MEATPKIRDGQIIKFLDGSFGVSLGDYWGDGDVSTVRHFDTEQEVLAFFPEADRERQRAAIALLNAQHSEQDARAELARLHGEAAQFPTSDFPDLGF